MSRRRRILAALAAVLCAAVVAVVGAPSASATPYTNRPTLKLSSGIVVVAHYMAVSGTGFVPYENVYISIDVTTNIVATVKADSHGNFPPTNVLVPGALVIGKHTVIGTGQFAQNGYDVAKVSVIVVLHQPLIGIPLAYQRPLLGGGPISDPLGDNTSRGEGLAVVAGIAGLVVVLLSSGSYLLLTARRRAARR